MQLLIAMRTMAAIAAEKEILLATVFRFASNTLVINMRAAVKGLGTARVFPA